MKETIQKHSTNNTQHSKYKYTYYQNTPTYTHPHTLQNNLKQPQYKIHTKWNSHNTIKYPQYKVTLMCMVLVSPKNFTVTHFTSLHFTLYAEDWGRTSLLNADTYPPNYTISHSRRQWYSANKPYKGGHCHNKKCRWYDGIKVKLSQRRLTADWLAPR